MNKINIGDKVNNNLVIDFYMRKRKKRAICMCHLCNDKYDIGYDVLLAGTNKSCPKCRCTKDLKGLRFNQLVVQYLSRKDSKGRIFWVCVCDCGNTKEISSNSLLNGGIKSCGHKEYDTSLIGKKFGELTLIDIDTGKRRGRNTVSLFKCSCGNFTEKTLSYIKTRVNATCGCKFNKKFPQVYNGITILDMFITETNEYYSNCICRCGKKFLGAFYHIRSGHVKSCGCIKIKNLVGKKFNKITVIDMLDIRQRGKIMYLCKCDCGKVWNVRGNHIKDMISCGCDKTKSIESAKNRCGQKSPSWNNNLTDADREKRRNRDITNNRQKVFVRDKYTCLLCNKTNCKLAAHHMDAYHWCKKDRVNMNNCITLCDLCHKKFHKIYGNKWNTVNQFVQFAKNKGVVIPNFILERCGER